MGLNPTGSAGVSQAVVDAALLLKLDAQTAADATARLALTGLTRGARVYQTDTGFWYELTNAAAPSDAASWQGIPKKYVALLTQSGTDAPVATVLENSLGGTVVWARVDVGDYTATLAGAFPVNKTTQMHGTFLHGGDALVSYAILRVSDNVMSAIGFDNTTTPIDFTVEGLTVQILVYPS